MEKPVVNNQTNQKLSRSLLAGILFGLGILTLPFVWYFCYCKVYLLALVPLGLGLFLFCKSGSKMRG